MEKNWKKKLKKCTNCNLKSANGITLVALVVTIIVLLILAGVALSSVLSQDGIFHRAEQAVDKHGEAKARETLELALGEAQMQKYDEGLTDEQLTEKINTIGEELPKEKPEHPELQNVIVDGHIFEIDRSVPKIVDYIGPADGVIITASVNGLSNGWLKPTEAANISVTGKIKTYSGGRITNSTATKGGIEIADFPTTGGDYTIRNITEETEIIIDAMDSNGKTSRKTIPINIKVDGTAPILSDATAIADRMKIKLSVNAEDGESGLKQINYNISPTTVNSAKGTLTSGQEIEVIATQETTYTITFTATDNVDNVSKGISVEVTTSDSITVQEAKTKINASNIREYIGTKVRDYTPEAGGTWRVFYYDDIGEFGRANTVYLKRDFFTYLKVNLKDYVSHIPSDGGKIMKRMNPMWRDSGNSEIDLENEHCVSWLCDPEQWKTYKTNSSSFAIGSPSIEMYMKAYNLWKTGNKDAENLICKIGNENGYCVGNNGSYKDNGYDTDAYIIESGPWGIFRLDDDSYIYYCIASPSAAGNNFVLNVLGRQMSINRQTIRKFKFNACSSFGFIILIDIQKKTRKF